MKTRLSLAVDTVFIALVSFVLTLILFNYFFERPFAITFAAVSAALLTLYSTKKLLGKNDKIKLTKAQLQEKKLAIAQLNLYTVTEQADLFEKLICKIGFKPERKRGYLYINEKKTAVFPRFGFDGITKTDIVKIFNTIKRNDVAYILCENFSQEIQSFVDRFDGRIKTVSADEIYKTLSENDLLPRTKFPFPEKKPLNASAFKNIFEKKKAKTHLLFGVTFLIMSYFVPIKIYYVICGSVFLLFALFCRLYGKELPKKAVA